MIKRINFLQLLDNVIDFQYITFSENAKEYFFIKNSKIFLWSIFDNNIVELSDELSFFCYKIFYMCQYHSILIIGDDGLYSFNINDKKIEKLLTFEYDYDTYFDYFEEIGKFIMILPITFRIILFDIKSLSTKIYDEKIKYEPFKVKYYSNKFFFILRSNSFEANIKIYDFSINNLEYDFKYKDYIYDLVYYEKSNQIIFHHLTADRKPSFVSKYDLETSKIINIENPDQINIISIATYNNSYFISFNTQSEKRIIFWKEDLSSNITCSGTLKGDICLFPNKNDFRTFLTYDKIKKFIYLWEII